VNNKKAHHCPTCKCYRPKVCIRSGCGVVFIPGRSDQMYHDHRCAASEQQSRYRARQKMEVVSA
jgi:hypothetical protein